jgi:hypothetical protein
MWQLEQWAVWFLCQPVALLLVFFRRLLCFPLPSPLSPMLMWLHHLWDFLSSPPSPPPLSGLYLNPILWFLLLLKIFEMY